MPIAKYVRLESIFQWLACRSNQILFDKLNYQIELCLMIYLTILLVTIIKKEILKLILT